MPSVQAGCKSVAFPGFPVPACTHFPVTVHLDWLEEFCLGSAGQPGFYLFSCLSSHLVLRFYWNQRSGVKAFKKEGKGLETDDLVQTSLFK